MMKLTLPTLTATIALAACADNPPPPPPAAVAVAAPANAYVCTQWNNGMCVSTHRVPGPAPYAVGYVFGPDYTYTAVTDLPQPLVTYYSLGSNYRYVYSNGYLYEVDPSNYTVVKVIDTYPG
jgi:hypothetical protein